MAANKLAQKYRDALGRADQSVRQDIDRVQHALFPHGAPQERVYGLSYYAARYGERAFVERILQSLEASDPFDPAVRDLSL